jgi:hypothetical protein
LGVSALRCRSLSTIFHLEPEGNPERIHDLVY